MTAIREPGGAEPAGLLPDGLVTDSTPGPALSASKQTAYASRLSQRRIMITVVAVMAGMFLAALDGTVVATALPTIADQLHGLDLYTWVISGYLIAEVSTIPLWGKFADMYGRKSTFLCGMGVFLLGSFLSGFAQSMPQLVGFRAIQGIGAGCLLPVAQTISGDLFTLEQRVKVQAIFSAMFGFASIVGPFIGGFLTEHLSWRWVFYVNMPVGIVAGLLVMFALVEPLQRRIRHSIDWAGFVCLIAFTCSLLYALEAGGRDFAWGSPVIVSAFLVSLVSVGALAFCELRATEPMLPLSLFSIPILRAASITSALIGMTMFGVVGFLPLFVQNVQGHSPTVAGRSLTPLMLGFMVSSFFSGRLLLRFGFRAMVFLGTSIAAVGLFLTTRFGVHTGQVGVGTAMVLIGFGFGICLVAAILGAQNSVGQSRMGVATSLINFTRQIGGAIGIAVAGAIFFNALAERLSVVFGRPFAAGDLSSPSSTNSTVPKALQPLVAKAFSSSLHELFVACFVLGLIAIFTGLLMPRGRPQDMDMEATMERERLVAGGLAD
jgi:EmrB/QacA subfamily drug resistance transporter